MRGVGFEKMLAAKVLHALDWLQNLGEEYPQTKNTEEIVTSTELLFERAINCPNLPPHLYSKELNEISHGINAIKNCPPLLNQVKASLPEHRHTSFETHDLRQTDPITINFDLMHIVTVHSRVDLEPVGINIISKVNEPGAVLSIVSILSLPTAFAYNDKKIQLILRDLLATEKAPDLYHSRGFFSVKDKSGWRTFYDLGIADSDRQIYFSRKLKQFNRRPKKPKEIKTSTVFLPSPNTI